MQTCCPESVCQGNEREAQADGGGQREGQAAVEREGTDTLIQM